MQVTRIHRTEKKKIGVCNEEKSEREFLGKKNKLGISTGAELKPSNCTRSETE